MAKLQPIEQDGQIVGYMYYCPGCKCYHAPYIRPHKNEVGASWTFNGNLERPTFSPSILTTVESPSGKRMVCHSFVTDGEIRYLSDCTHSMAGKNVPVPDENEE